MTFQFIFVIFVVAAASFCTPAKAEEKEIELVWTEQLARTATHSFMVQLGSYRDEYTAKAIRVVDRKTGALVQEINDIDALGVRKSPPRFVTLVDANADRHPDIELSAGDGGAGPNNSEYFYLFDPKAGQYRFHAGLSELTQAGVAADGAITSAARGGCCHHAAQTHRFINGEFTLIKSWERSLTTDGKWMEVTTGVRKNGKMRYKTTRRRPPAGY